MLRRGATPYPATRLATGQLVWSDSDLDRARQALGRDRRRREFRAGRQEGPNDAA
jgi:hypothetical protein